LIRRAVRKLRSGLKRLMGLTGFPRIVKVKCPGGPRLRFRLHNSVEQNRIVEKGGEEETWAAFLRLLKPDDVVYDIGASVGIYSVAAGAMLPSSRVVAFEPDPETRSHLQANVSLNGLRNVEVIEWAVGDKEGTVELFTDGASGWAPSLFAKQIAKAPKGKIQVQQRSLDACIASGELPPPSVMKIDIEGAEGLCLRGSRKLLAGSFGARPRLVLLEVHPDFLPSLGSSQSEVESILEDHGYVREWSKHRSDQIHCLYKAASRDES